jgi:hypothetical protein
MSGSNVKATGDSYVDFLLPPAPACKPERYPLFQPEIVNFQINMSLKISRCSPLIRNICLGPISPFSSNINFQLRVRIPFRLNPPEFCNH